MSIDNVILYSRIEFARSASILVAATVFSGCATQVVTDQTPTSLDASVTPDEVLVRFRNFAESEAVDVEFYATNNPLAVLPDDLFQEANRVTASIGVAGTSIVQPLRVDAITFTCTEHLTMGTTGGSFLDNETGQARGIGTMRWVQEGPLGLCGHVVTFEFRPDGEGFVTLAMVGD
jgi:hypothetical protein